MPATAPMPELPAFVERSRGGHGTLDKRAGVSIDLSARFDTLAQGQILLDNRTPDGKGFLLQTGKNGSVEIVLNDGRTENRWSSDQNALSTGKSHHISVIVDGGPKIITFVVDGKLHDGGAERQFGWGRFSRDLRGLNGASQLRIGKLARLRIYDRAIRTSEAIANHRANGR